MVPAMGELRADRASRIALGWLAGICLGLALMAPAQAVAQESENPFEADEDPFAEDDGSEGQASESEGEEEIPPPTVPEGYGNGGGQQPPPQQGYAQPAQPGYGQPVYPGTVQQRPPRLQRMPYREGMEIPPGGRVVAKRRTGLLISGAAMFGISYATSITLYLDVVTFREWMLVPVIGPFVEIGNDDITSGGRLLLAIDGLVQTTGLTLFILGLVSKRHFVEYYAELNEPGWRVRPRLGATGGGLDLSARF